MKSMEKSFDFELKLEGNLLVVLKKTSVSFFLFSLTLNYFGEYKFGNLHTKLLGLI